MSEAYSYLCIGGPAHGTYYASPNPDRLKVAVAPPLQATFIENDLSEIVAGPMYATFEYEARKFTVFGRVKTLWTDPQRSNQQVYDGLILYLLEKFATGEIR